MREDALGDATAVRRRSADASTPTSRMDTQVSNAATSNRRRRASFALRKGPDCKRSTRLASRQTPMTLVQASHASRALKDARRWRKQKPMRRYTRWRTTRSSMTLCQWSKVSSCSTCLRTLLRSRSLQRTWDKLLAMYREWQVTERKWPRAAARRLRDSLLVKRCTLRANCSLAFQHRQASTLSRSATVLTRWRARRRVWYRLTCAS